jgi:hypothetical protein
MARRYVLLFLLVLAAAGGLVLARALRHEPGDEEQIRALFDDAARAAEEKRIGDAVRGVSERFDAQGMDKRGVKQLIALHVLRGSWVTVTVAGAKVDVQGDAARAVVDAVMARSGKGTPVAQLVPEQATAYRFDVHLAREQDGWRATHATWSPISLEEAVAGPELRSAR